MGVEDDAQTDEAMPRQDDEDERMYTKFMDKFSQDAMQDKYPGEPTRPARFDDTDNEETKENTTC